jgi:hydrogenase nickel incorporation protein HypA/HybF
VHELSIARNIVDAVKRRLPAGEKRCVKSVTLRLGDFTRLLPDSLELCFELASEGTSVQGARLEIKQVPIRCGCTTCGSGFEAGRFVAVCPVCGNSTVDLLSGNELDVVAFELSD